MCFGAKLDIAVVVEAWEKIMEQDEGVPKMS